MAGINLKIDDLDLDLENPRIMQTTGQHEAMQRILDDQGVKLVNLADSIIEAGLNPMDRLLVMKAPENKKKYIVLEGNRRLLALRLLKNPTALAGLDVRQGIKARLEALAGTFDAKSVEPIACFEVADRAEGNAWIEQRHTGENEGRGIVDWSGVAAARFRGRDPALQALDFVLRYGKLTDEQRAAIFQRFPITTLDRILSTPDARSKIGFDVKGGKLYTNLPAEEAIKPLRRIVLDLLEKAINVTALKLKNRQVDYVSSLGKDDAPDLTKKTSTPKAIEGIGDKDFPSTQTQSPKKPKKKNSSERQVPISSSANLISMLQKSGKYITSLLLCRYRDTRMPYLCSSGCFSKPQRIIT
jgi:hypothetical protein